ncbi:MAG TPA: hypothetical protein VLW53_03400, partial [Candidatus Eisenbacteria bacterium]|nr:hypothetical protein [Candidatus Eisenbacteria bacterium]
DVHELVTFERLADRLSSRDVRDCRFVPLRGACAGPERQLPLDAGGLYLSTTRDDVDRHRLAAALHAGGGEPGRLPVPLTPEELLGGFRLWLALRTPDFCVLSLEGRALRGGGVRAWERSAARAVRAPGESARFASVPGLLEGGAICLLERGEGEEVPVLRGYGDAGRVVQRLRSHLEEWHGAGRPFAGGLSVEAFPLAAANGEGAVPAATFTGTSVEKRWFRYLLRPLPGPE